MDADPFTLYEATRRWYLHLRGAMCQADADAQAASWLAVRCAEIAVNLPAGNARLASQETRSRFEAVQHAVFPLCIRTIVLLAAGRHDAARECLSRALDLATAAPAKVA